MKYGWISVLYLQLLRRVFSRNIHFSSSAVRRHFAVRLSLPAVLRHHYSGNRAEACRLLHQYNLWILRIQLHSVFCHQCLEVVWLTSVSFWFGYWETLRIFVLSGNKSASVPNEFRLSCICVVNLRVQYWCLTFLRCFACVVRFCTVIVHDIMWLFEVQMYFVWDTFMKVWWQ